MATPTYKIVKIIDDQNIVISGGKNRQINEGDKFTVIDKNSEEIIDPDTFESLGYLYKSKGTVIATTVYDQLTILSSIEVPTNLNSFMFPPRQTTLDVNEDQITGGLESGPISIGDYVQKI